MLRYVPVLLFILGWLPRPTLAQKVDLDKFYFDVNYIQLPRQYVQPDERTVGIRIGLGSNIRRAYPEQAIFDNINVAGFRKVEANPAVGITFTMSDLRVEKTEIKTRQIDRKDKSGKTMKVDQFTLVATFSTAGRFQLYGPKTGESRTVQQTPAAQPNRFLQAIAGEQAVNPATYSALITSNYFPNTISYSTREYDSANEANQYFERNQRSIQNELITNYINNALKTINEQVNTWYGYVPTHSREFLWILDSKNHPEYAIQQEAIKAVKTLMPTMQPTESTTQLARNLQPVLDYFNEMKTRFTGTDKADVKMRYSAFYNLATLYYWLDQPDAVGPEAEGLLKNGYDTSDGKRFVRLADDLRNSLGKHQLAGRHMPL